METQVKGARPKQKNYAQGQRKALDRDKRKLPSDDIEPARRSFVVSTTTKRAVARFAKGPCETGGFTYPRQRVVSKAVSPPLVTVCLKEPPQAGSTSMIESFEPVAKEQENVKQIGDEGLYIMFPEITETHLEPLESVSSEPISENGDENYSGEKSPAAISSEEQPIELHPADSVCVKFEQVSTKVEDVRQADSVSDISQVIDTQSVVESHDTLDDTIGPGSSEESSSEEEDAQVTKPIAIVMPAKQIKPKLIIPPVARKAAAPVSTTFRKVIPVSPPLLARSSWSKFLPLVIEIKATIPYPMHLLGLTLLVGTCLLLRLLYQFGAGIGEGMDLQGQLLMLAKLVFLFVVIVICVNFVEDNKELRHKEPSCPAQPKLRPSKVSKNKKKLMMKV